MPDAHGQARAAALARPDRPALRRQPGFIPPIRQQIRDFFEGKAPYLRYGGIEFLAVSATATVVGRTTAHTHSKLDAKLGARHLLFGFTEFVDDRRRLRARSSQRLEARARAPAPSACWARSTCCRTSPAE